MQIHNVKKQSNDQTVLSAMYATDLVPVAHFVSEPITAHRDESVDANTAIGDIHSCHCHELKIVKLF